MMKVHNSLKYFIQNSIIQHYNNTTKINNNLSLI